MDIRFLLFVVFSTCLHAGAALLWIGGAEDKPAEVPLYVGRYSIESKASIAVTPRPDIRHSESKKSVESNTAARPVEKLKPKTLLDEMPVALETPMPLPMDQPEVKSEALLTPDADSIPLPKPKPEARPQPAPPEATTALANPSLQQGEKSSDKPDPRPNSKPAPASLASVERSRGAFARSELSHEQTPVYPLEAQRRGIQGYVQVWVRISTDGRALEVTIQHSSGYQLLDDETVRFCRTARWNPARRGDRAVESERSFSANFYLH